MKMAAMAAQLVPSPPSLESQGARGTGNFSRRWARDQVSTCSPWRVSTGTSGTELPPKQGRRLWAADEAPALQAQPHHQT